MNISKEHPPKWAHRLLVWFLKDELIEEVEGDLLEKFEQQIERSSLHQAKLHYWYQVFNYIRPFAVRSNWFSQFMSYAMLQNYLKVAWRNLLRYKMYTFIKIGGFALGIAACLLIALFIQDELGFDNHYEQGDRVYRLINRDDSRGEVTKGTAFQAPISNVLTKDFPEIETVARLIPYDWYNAGSNQFRPLSAAENNLESTFAYADPSLLDILEIDMIHGSSESALAEPNTIVISRKIADKYFPNQDPVGETVILNEKLDAPFKVGGVIEDFPPNVHLKHDFFITLVEVEFWPGEQANWCCSNYNTYIRLKPGASAEALTPKLLSIRDNYLVPFFRRQNSQGADEIAEHYSLELQPIRDIHLHSKGIDDHNRHSDIRIVWLFGGIAILILLLAVINFINLSTAKSANRAKEVGLRKVVGSFRSNLIRQFLTESVLFSLLAFVLGVLFASAALPFFNAIAGKSLMIPWTDWRFYPILTGSLLFIGLLAGLYPSLYLSRFRPIQVLKGSLSLGSKNKRLQGTLVVLQFSISVILIISAFVVSRQMNFILNTELGYEKEQVLVLHGTNTLGEQLPTLKEQLLQLSSIRNATASNFLPVSDSKRDANTFWKEGTEQEELGTGAQIWEVDEDYLATLGIQMGEGRNFSRDIASDATALIINRRMAKRMGLENPIGQRVTNGFRPPFTIIGVMEDFHFESMKGRITPLCLELVKSTPASLAVKLEAEQVSDAIAEMTAVWDDFLPNQPIRYTFLDERFANMYEGVERTRKIFTGFSFLAIIIACLGLFALSSFMVEQRKKEVSIRKVLGASSASLFQLLTRYFLQLVCIAFVIAMPIGWFLMRKWLEDYTYGIDISWDIFLIAGGVTLLIAMLTVSIESLRAAINPPIDNLRSE